jgi:hypothetical protein
MRKWPKDPFRANKAKWAVCMALEADTERKNTFRHFVHPVLAPDQLFTAHR